MHFLFCLLMSQNLKELRGGKKIFCQIGTRAFSMSHVRVFYLKSISYSGVRSVPVFLTGHLALCSSICMKTGDSTLFLVFPEHLGKAVFLDGPFCLDLFRNSFVASDPHYFVSARSCCDQYVSFM